MKTIIGTRTDNMAEYDLTGLTAERLFYKIGRETVDTIITHVANRLYVGRDVLVSIKWEGEMTRHLPTELHQIFDAYSAVVQDPMVVDAGGQLMLTVNHEQDRFDNPEGWAAMLNRVAEVCPHIEVGPIVTSYLFDPEQTKRTVDEWLFDSGLHLAAMSFVGVDHYPERVSEGTWNAARHFAGSKLLLAEFGLHHATPAEKAQSFLTHAVQSPAGAFYFDLDRSDVEKDPEKNWLLDPTSRAAVGGAARAARLYTYA